MKKALLMALLTAGTALLAEETPAPEKTPEAPAPEVTDERPAFDKTPHKATLWTHVNPWFPPSKPRQLAYGGPDYAWRPDMSWADAMAECVRYGITGWQVEMHEPNGGWMKAFRGMLEEAKKSGSPIQLMPFIGFFSADEKKSAEALIRILGEIKDEMKDHPNLYRIGGSPVLMVHVAAKYKPEQWKYIISEVEKVYGRLIWLANVRGLDNNPKTLGDRLRAYMKYFDGIGNYGGSGVDDQKLRTDVIAEVMHKEFPQKIYEAGVHTTYTCHFHMGGLPLDLSRFYRESFDIALNADPDAVSITNLFDHYENSLSLPCYERQDLIFRYAQFRLAKHWGKPCSRHPTPELVLTNDIMILPGRRDLHFEVIGFPFANAERNNLSVGVELCNSAGEVLKTFPLRKMDLTRDIQVERFSVPSMDFAEERSVHPRLVYEWRGRQYRMNWNPMTLITPSIRSYWMYWARSTRHELALRQAETKWHMDGKTIGETLTFPADGLADFSLMLKANWDPGWNRGYRSHSILRNGMHLHDLTDATAMAKDLVLNIPIPGGALNYYQIEVENKNGCRYLSLPVWVSDGSRPGKVKIPFLLADGSVQTREIEAARVPYFDYLCDRDAGPLLIDSSGYMHNGCINGSGYGGGHLGHTDHYYYHNGPIPAHKKSFFRRDETGRGMITLDGKDFIMIMGGTAFPGAATFEACVRPAALGKIMGIFGTANNQINVCILEDGRVRAWRGTEEESAGGVKPARKPVTHEVVSQTRVEPGKWVRIAVVYDLEKLKLFINGVPEAETASPPFFGHTTLNHMTVGSLCGWVWNPKDRFVGDIGRIRLYGRNLEQHELLK